MKLLLLVALHTIFVARSSTSSHNSDGYSVLSDHQIPEGWKQTGKPDQTHLIRLSIGIKHGAFEDLERHLYHVSDPDHQHYGQYLSASDTCVFTAPAARSLLKVQSWLAGQGVDLSRAEFSTSKDWITLVLPIWKIESLLHTQYHIYADETRRQLVRTSSYSLPKYLHQHVDIIQPTNYFGSPGRGKRAPLWIPMQYDSQIARTSAGSRIPNQHSQSVITACNMANVSITCLRNLYRTIDYVPQVPVKNSVGFTNYRSETAKYDDLHLWLQKFRPDADPNYKFAYEVIANGINNQSAAYNDTYEANIDVQALAGFVYPTQLTAYTTGGNPPWQHVDHAEGTHPDQNTNEPYLTFLDWLLQKRNEDIPYIISTSYGDDERSVPLDYARRVCQELAILSVRGITLLFGSGDTGVGSAHTCGSSDRFRTYFPASCPYVTAVGATSGLLPEVVGRDETGIVTGGGFSEYFARPKYQLETIERYLTSIGRLHETRYNRSGRAYPDMAAHGVKFMIVDGGELDSATGTSVAVQIAAGVLTNVNDALLAAGRPQLGFLNPWLYRYGTKTGFNDITAGTMTGCNTSGFPATEGWDIASGWGTPDFKNVTEFLLTKGKT